MKTVTLTMTENKSQDEFLKNIEKKKVLILGGLTLQEVNV
jgi:hypothetical protein